MASSPYYTALEREQGLLEQDQSRRLLTLSPPPPDCHPDDGGVTTVLTRSPADSLARTTTTVCHIARAGGRHVTFAAAAADDDDESDSTNVRQVVLFLKQMPIYTVNLLTTLSSLTLVDNDSRVDDAVRYQLRNHAGFIAHYEHYVVKTVSQRFGFSCAAAGANWEASSGNIVNRDVARYEPLPRGYGEMSKSDVRAHLMGEVSAIVERIRLSTDGVVTSLMPCNAHDVPEYPKYLEARTGLVACLLQPLMEWHHKLVLDSWMT